MLRPRDNRIPIYIFSLNLDAVLITNGVEASLHQWLVRGHLMAQQLVDHPLQLLQADAVLLWMLRSETGDHSSM
jgi:hypothetical protein